MASREQIVEEVKKYPFLYNKKEREYKNTQKKSRTWEEISKRLNLEGGEECARRWKSLRDRYCRELKKYNEARVSGAESRQLEFHEWDLFEAMSFLKDYCEPNKRTITNYKSVRDVEVQNLTPPTPDEKSVEMEPKPGTSASFASISTEEATPKHKKRGKRALEEVNREFIEAASSFKEMCSSIKKKEPTADELFGQRVVAFVGAIENDEEKDNVKRQVLKYLADCVSQQYS